MFQDLRFAVHQLHKYSGFSFAIILTLALGIGVNTAVFSMVNSFLLRVLPYPQPEHMAALVSHNEKIDPRNGKTSTEEGNSFDAASWQILKDNIKGLTFASYGGGGNGVTLKTDAVGGMVRYAHVSCVSAHYFDVLGVPVYRGRGFTEKEDRPHGPPVAVLSYGLWASTFWMDLVADQCAAQPYPSALFCRVGNSIPWPGMGLRAPAAA